MTGGTGGSGTAVVTGAAQGIGAATARRLARDGWTVLLADIDPLGEQVADEITATGAAALFVRCDVSSEQDWEAVRVGVTHIARPLSALVSNAFTVQVAGARELALESWQRQLAVNLTGAFLGVRTLLPELQRHGGSIVLVSSVHARIGVSGHPAYAASKGGLTALTRQLAVEYGPSVRVNAVLPGPILTGAWADVGEQDRRTSAAGTAAGRLGEPDEVAAAIAFLLSTDASYITGAELLVDGGWTAQKDSR